MFIQVVRGRTGDAAAMRDAHERWKSEIRPGAIGYLGSAVGVADDGTFVAILRFESEAAARLNSDRREQSAWWAETSRLLDGQPQFYDCSIVDFPIGEIPDSAGFIQLEVFKNARDMDEMRRIDEEVGKFGHLRPDLLCVVTAAAPDRTMFATNYFTSEEDARAAEKVEPPSELVALFQRWMELTDGVEYIDLRDPWLDASEVTTQEARS